MDKIKRDPSEQHRAASRSHIQHRAENGHETETEQLAKHEDGQVGDGGGVQGTGPRGRAGAHRHRQPAGGGTAGVAAPAHPERAPASRASSSTPTTSPSDPHLRIPVQHLVLKEAPSWSTGSPSIPLWACGCGPRKQRPCAPPARARGPCGPPPAATA